MSQETNAHQDKVLTKTYQVIAYRNCKISVVVAINSREIWLMAANSSYIANKNIPTEEED